MRTERLQALMHGRYGVHAGHAVSAPGRVELGGNHTDHNNGKVLAASVDLDMLAVAAPLDTADLIVYSEARGDIRIDLSDLAPQPAEAGTSKALLRGIARYIQDAGFSIGGLLIVLRSDVLPGSGLSSSAAFEILLGGVFSAVYNGGSIPPVQLAKIGRRAENNYFGKPSGLMDQLASAVGGVMAIDFAADDPVIETVDVDLAAAGYALVIVNSRSSHADLTPAYAAIPHEMADVAAAFGVNTLREIDPGDFDRSLGRLRALGNDRAILRAMHYFAENERVPAMLQALGEGDLKRYFALVRASGQSSVMWLQNTRVEGQPAVQPLSVALAASERFLAGDGATRIQGGGFAGTIQTYVPVARVAAYMSHMDALFGENSCTVVHVRPEGVVIRPLS